MGQCEPSTGRLRCLQLRPRGADGRLQRRWLRQLRENTIDRCKEVQKPAARVSTGDSFGH